MSEFQTKGFIHSGVTVRKLDDSIEFYKEYLGMNLLKKQTAENNYVMKIVQIPGLERVNIAFLEFPDGHVIEMLEYDGLQTFSAESRSCDYGSGHICIEVENVQVLFDKLLDNGKSLQSKEVVEITEGINKGSKAIYFRDPDGYIIEAMERSKTR